MQPEDLSEIENTAFASAHEEFERRAWDEMHATYDEYFGRITARASDALLSAVELGPGIRLLEVACGTGNVSNSAHKAGAKVIGIDFVPGMVDEAKKLHPGIDFRVGDAQALTFDDDTFDAVVCNFGIHHFSKPLRALKDAYRVLKAGGRYAFTVWSPPSTVKLNLRQIIREAVEKYADFKDALPSGPPESFFASPENCLKTLEEVGFTEISTTEISLIGNWDQPEHVLDTIYRAMIRSKTLIEAQSKSNKLKIEAEILARAREFIGSGIVEIPMPAMLTLAHKI